MSIKRIENLPENFVQMKEASLAEGFEFLSKMEKSWHSGENIFNKQGEVLFVVIENGKPVGICGLNIDPYADNKNIGRVRHLYIMPSARRKGLARKLVEAVTTHAPKYFEILRLRTNNPEACKFYENLGFNVSNKEFETHYKKLDDFKIKEKVLAYIFRRHEGSLQVLVFDHPNVPEVNPQVPAGTLKNNEKPEDGVLREIFEESGLKFNKADNYLGQFEHIADYKNEIHNRHVYSIMSSGLPDSWSHNVKSHDEDNGEMFDYYWLPLEEAKEKLVVDLGKYLPTVNGHFVNTVDIHTKWFNEELKIGGLNSNISKYFGLKKIAAQYFKIPSGYRSSEPHAESHEEEFVYVISGQIDLWLNGRIKKMGKGDCIGFPAGTGIGHCFINNYDEPCEIFVSGDRTKETNQYHFHLDPSLETECGDKWWRDMPKQLLGGHDALPGEFEPSLIDNNIKTLNGFDHFTDDSFSYPNDNEEFINAVYLSRHFGMKNIAVNLVRIPVGRRSSWPHAHSIEEEFIFVLDGNPIVSLDGEEYESKPLTGIEFKAGSGVAHTLINNSNEYIYYLCVGECEPRNDKIYYPNHPDRNVEVREEGWLWLEMVKDD